VLCLVIVSSIAGAGCHPQPRIIKIGLVAPFEGTYRAIGYDAIYAARLAVREINAAGGIDGNSVALIAYDDRGDPGMAQTSAENLAVDPDVIAVIGHYRPETSERAASIYAQAEMAFLVLGLGVTDEAPVVRLAPSPADLAEALAADADLAAGTSTTVWSHSGWSRLVEEALVDLNLTVTGGREVQNLEPVLNLLPPLAAAEATDWARDAGWRGPHIGTLNLASPAFGRLAPTENVHFVTCYPAPQDLEGLEEWTAAYQRVGPHVPEPGPYALPTYEAVYVLAEALSVVLADDGGITPTVERATVRNALRELRHDGPLGAIAWDDRGYWADAPLFVYRWTENGPQLISRWR
jgi:ABC-type branched-subunit amino acid transport system substrate-binding protein